MIDVLKKRLDSWGNRFLSFGGRIVLLNSVLSAIPIFYLSFMMMPAKVWKEVVKIQRNFLWSGLDKKTKICWVKWDLVTKPKDEGGLGVRDLRRVNLSLLANWQWRFLDPSQSGWKALLIAKYGVHLASDHIQQLNDDVRRASTWWKDICNLQGDRRWFEQATAKKVGDGGSTSLWCDSWLGNFSLRDRFPRLYSISNMKEVKVADSGYWENNIWSWPLRWRRSLFVWEKELRSELMGVLQGAELSSAGDKWIWTEDSGGVFSVKTCYELLTRCDSLLTPFSEDQKFVFRGVWKSVAPLKVLASRGKRCWIKSRQGSIF
jgi:hypothetical protein